MDQTHKDPTRDKYTQILSSLLNEEQKMAQLSLLHCVTDQATSIYIKSLKHIHILMFNTVLFNALSSIILDRGYAVILFSGKKFS